MKYLSTIFIIATTFLFGCQTKVIKKLPFKITDSVYNTETSEFTIEIPERYSISQIDTICSDVWSRNVFHALKIYFVLPGQVVGEGFTYGYAFYPFDEDVKQSEEFKDLAGVPLEINIKGLNKEKAAKLLAVNPPNLLYKTIIGKFINDLYESVTIVYTDSREEKGRIFIMDFDITGQNIKENNVSPYVKQVDGGKRYIIDKDGDFYTLNDNILKRYNIEEDSTKAYRSIKSGI